LVLENIWDDMMKVKIDDYYWPKKWKTSDNNKNSEGSKNTDSSTVMINKDNDHGTMMVITGQWMSAWYGSC